MTRYPASPTTERGMVGFTPAGSGAAVGTSQNKQPRTSRPQMHVTDACGPGSAAM
jgi:hypothetical protein